MTSEETEIQLVPAPGSTPEFLATVAPLEATQSILPFEIVLDKYTRETWSRLSMRQDLNMPWKIIKIITKDERSSKKIEGFMKYLKERKKSVMGKCDILNDNDEGSAGNIQGCFLVPFDQNIEKSEINNQLIVFKCKVLHDCSLLKKSVSTNMQMQQQKIQVEKQKQIPAPVTKAAPKPNPIKSSGFMGKLLGKSNRTGIALATVPKSSVTMKANNRNENVKLDVINSFRQDVEETLNSFLSNASLPTCKLHVCIADILRQNKIDKMNAPEGLTMEVLKYIVYESIDEIGKDKWIAYKEPSEFIDDYNISVYKEGQAPPEVLEEVNKGEIPDEVKAAQRAMMVAVEREVARKEGKKDAQLLESAVGNVTRDDLSTLNTIKRDRRTIEEIQNENKRQRI